MSEPASSRFSVPTVAVAQAKSDLPRYLELARDHHIQIVTRYGRDEVVMLAHNDFLDLMRMPTRTFQTEVAIHKGQSTVSLPQFGIIGIGPTVDDATDDALVKLREFAQQFEGRWNFYKETDQRNLAKLVWRFLATPEDEQASLLLESDDVEATPVLV